MSAQAQGAARFGRRHTLHNTAWFLSGKLLSALATLAWLGLVARLLMEQQEYARYVSVLAYLETTLAISMLGFDWLVIRHLPACVGQGNGLGLRRLLWGTVRGRLLVTSGLAATVVAAGAWMRLPAEILMLVALWGGLLISESALRLLRDCALEALAAQRLIQLGVLGRTLLALLGLGILQWKGLSIGVHAVLAVELAASLTFLGVVALWTWRLVRKVSTSEPDGAPSWSQAWKGCWHNYQSALIGLPLTPQAWVVLASQFTDAKQLQVFGFVVRLFEVLRNYLPGLLLMSVLRPRLLGRFAVHRDFAQVAGEAEWVSRLSALSLTVLLAWLTAYGDWLLVRLAGPELATGRWVLLALLATLVLRVHRQLGQLLVNCVGEVPMLSRIAGIGLIGWLVAFAAAVQGHPTIGVVFAVAWDEWIWVMLLSRGLSSKGWSWPLHGLFWLQAMTVAVLSGLALRALLPPLHAWAVGLGSSLLLGLLAALFLALRWIVPRELLATWRGGRA